MWDLECSGTSIGWSKCGTQTEILIGRHKNSPSTDTLSNSRTPFCHNRTSSNLHGQAESNVMETSTAHVPTLKGAAKSYILAAFPGF